jgi:hypothetical protein
MCIYAMQHVDANPPSHESYKAKHLEAVWLNWQWQLEAPHHCVPG